MKKYWIGLLTGLLLIFCFGLGAMAAKSSPAVATATTKATSLAGGGSTVMTIAEGEKLNVYREQSVNKVLYYQIYKGGKYCWIQACYVYLTNTAKPAVEDRIGQGKTRTKVTIYELPSTSSKAVGTIPAGRVRNLYAQSGNWYQINSNGRFVWVRVNGFDYTKAMSSKRIMKATVRYGDVQTYYGPGRDFERSIVLKRGTVCNVYALSDDGWMLLYRGGRYVWAK